MNREQAEQLQHDLNQIVAPMLQFAKQATEAISEAALQTFEQLKPMMQAVHDAMYQAYQDHGMPYGDTHEGLLRWMDDLSKINQAQQEIERIQQRHQTLIHARQLGERIRAKRALEAGNE
jgi:hypothetical protein